MIKSSFNLVHKPVLLNESINLLTNKKNTIFIDGTFGDGGHTRALLEKNKTCKVYAIDRDPNVKENARFFQEKYNKRFKFISGKISDLEKIASHENLKNKINGIIFDLGVSTRQLKDSKRGFSFQNDGPLDMRMDQTSDISAETWVNQSTKEEIAKVFWEKGEERKSRKIAELICNERNITPIHTTLDLVKIIMSCKPRTSKRHPATNIFRAIRMEVNSEMDELKKVLDAAGKILKKGGRLAVISFHSIEDRVVKRFIQGKSIGANKFSFKRVGRKYIRPNKEEIQNNPRSRSAILRVAEKVA